MKPFLKAKVTFEHLSEDLENVREKVPERCEESEQVRSQGRGNVTEQDPVGWGEGGSYSSPSLPPPPCHFSFVGKGFSPLGLP